MKTTQTPRPATTGLTAGQLSQLAYEATLPLSLSSPADRLALAALAAQAYAAEGRA